MPRETVIHGSQYTSYKHGYDALQKLDESERAVAEAEMESRQNPNLDVNWNRDNEWVQVALVVDRKYLEEYLSTSEDPRLSIPTEVMSRKDINALIRTLRRARDSAYGSDE